MCVWLSFVSFIYESEPDDHSSHISFSFADIQTKMCNNRLTIFITLSVWFFVFFTAWQYLSPLTVQRRTADFISLVFLSWKTVTMAWNEDNKHRISCVFRVKPNTNIFLPSSYLVSKSKQPLISDRFWTFTALNSIWMWLAKLNNSSTHIPGIQITSGNQ